MTGESWGENSGVQKRCRESARGIVISECTGVCVHTGVGGGGKGGGARVIKWTVRRLLFVLSGPLKEEVTKHPWEVNLGRELLFSAFKTESLEAASV